VLIGQQVYAQRPDPRPVLCRGHDGGWEHTGHLVPAHAAPPVRASRRRVIELAKSLAVVSSALSQIAASWIYTAMGLRHGTR
jgi:hypothetical protein